MIKKKLKYRIIWIDDKRNPVEYMASNVIPKEFQNLVFETKSNYEIIWLKSFKEWIEWAKKNWFGNKNKKYIDCFCLDHDLGDFDENGKEYTGATVAKTIINDILSNNKQLPYYECHSSNPAGRNNIVSIFETYEKYLIQ